MASRAHNFPMLASLARRVLVVPTSQAQSERLFSTTGLIVKKRHSSLSADNMGLLVSLRNSWAAVDAIMKSKGATQPPVRIS